MSYGRCHSLKKNVSLFASLILVFQQADLLWLYFWKLAALGRILWPVLWFWLWLCQSSLIPVESVLLGLDAYSLFVYSTGDFVTGPGGMDCIQFLYIYDGNRSQNAFQVLGNHSSTAFQNVLLFYFFFNLLSVLGFSFLHIKEVCMLDFFLPWIENDGVEGWKVPFWGGFLSFCRLSFVLVCWWRS